MSATARAAADRRTRVCLLALKTLVFCVIVLQRITLPGVNVSIAILVAVAVAAVLRVFGCTTTDPWRTVTYLVAMCAALLGTAIVQIDGHGWSLTSLALLLVLYSPFVYTVRPELRAVYPRLLTYFNRLVLVCAGLAVWQFYGQFVGLPFMDPFSWFMPSSLLLHGYNTFYPVHYGASLMKTNGVVFLEPSFASQFFALAILIEVIRRRTSWRLLVLGLALVATISGTGLILLAVGLVAVAVQRGGRWAAKAAVATAAAALVIGLTPVGSYFAQRTTEASTQNSSGSLRFIQPYQDAFAGFPSSAADTVRGVGPGGADRRAAEYAFLTGRPLTAPAVPKLVEEYGLLTLVAFAVFLTVAVFGGAPSTTLAVVEMTQFVILNSSLLQPQTVALMWVLTSLFAHPGLVREHRRAFRRGRHRVPLPGISGLVAGS